MNKLELTLKSWRGAKNPFGDPETRQEQEIWEQILEVFQTNPERKYLKYFHQYKFTPDQPEVIVNKGTIAEAPIGMYDEILTIYFQ